MNWQWKLAKTTCILIALATSMLALDGKDTLKKEKSTETIIHITPEQMNLQMLETARSELAGASASLRTHTCYQASLGFSRIDKARQVAQLKQCFKDSLGIDEKDAAKPSLQL